MLDWQKKWISDELIELCENTKCNIKLLDQLRGRGLITDEEVNDLERMTSHDEHGGYKKVRELYLLLKTRDAYDELIQILEQNCQTDAANILKNGWETQDNESRKKKRRLENYVSLPEGLEEFLNRNKLYSGNICVISTLDCDVTCERIKEAGGIPVVKWEETSFGSELNEHTTIAISHVENVEQMVSYQISNVMKNSRRIIIITKKSKEDVQKEVPKSFPITVTEDKLTLQDLSKNFRDDLLNRNVLIQGRLLPFQEWINATRVSLNDNVVGGELLIDLIKNKTTPVLLKNTLPKKLNYYVSRSFRSKTVLSSDKVFQNRSADVFLFSGLERHQLSTLVSEGHEALRKKNSDLDKTPPATDSSKYQIKKTNLSVRYILIEHFSDFEDICDRTLDPVHWVQCEESGRVCRLVKSRGSKKVIQGMVEDKNKQNECTEKKFLDFISSEDFGDLSEQHVCISDSPGMGKSVLLAEVGRQSLEKNTTTVGIFQELPEFIKSIKEKLPNEETRCADAIIQHLFSSLTTCDFSKSCLESGVKSQAVKINLFLDAYDEVDSENVSLCKTILKVIKDRENIRVFITSRPHLLHELENIFEVLGWNILPFTQKDQCNFLLSSWKNRPEGQRYKNMKIDESKLEKYTNKFVSTLQNQWNDKDRAIAGIPLQCHLISVIFHVEAFKSCKQGSSPNSSEPSPEIGSLTNLYTRMVEKKLEIFKEKYPTTSLDSTKVNNWYAAQAFCDLFPDVDYEVLLGEDDADPEAMIRIGIVERKGDGGKMEFIHRTFAEYFIAKALFQFLTNPQESSLSLKFITTLVSFLKVVFTLVKGEHEGHKLFQWLEILYHLNALLEDANTVCEIPLNLNFSEDDLTKLTNSIVREDLPNIFELLQNWNCFTDIEKNIFNLKLLKTAFQYSSLKLIKMVIQYRTKKRIMYMCESSRNRKNTSLHYAVGRGDFSIFEFILETYFKDKVKNCQDSKNIFSSLFHVCVGSSLRNSDVIISDKIYIIKRLLELNNGLLEFSLEGRTPILCHHIHPQLLNFLIEREANVFAIDNNDMTVLDIASRSNMSLEEFCHLLQILYQAGHLQTLISNSSSEIFKRFLWFKTLTKDCFTILKKVEVNLKTISDCILESTLHLKKEAIVECVKDFYYVWTEKEIEINPIKQFCLDIAIKRYNLTILAWLIDTKGLNVNCVNSVNGDTPLHQCSRIKYCWKSFNTIWMTPKIVEIINFLLKKGGDPRILNFQRESVLHLAAENSCDEIVKMFIDIVEDINGQDCNGNTALLRAVKSEDFNSILNNLLKHGADPKMANNGGETLLHHLYSDHLWVDRLVDGEGLSVNSTDKKGNTPLHFAALESGCLKVISKLVEKGGNINAVNEDGFTPFDVYLCQADSYSLEVVKYFISRVPNKDQMTTSLRSLIYRKFELPSLERESMPPNKLSLSCLGNSMFSEDGVTTAGMIANELISNGADVKGLISQIFKCFETSNSTTQIEFLKLLHENGVCSSEIPYQGLALMVKCYYISEEYMKFGNSFADHLDDINKTDSEGRTLLQLACEARSLQGVKFLVKKGAKVNELDGSGKTLLDVIHLDCLTQIKINQEISYMLEEQIFNKLKIAKYLEKHGAKDSLSYNDRDILNNFMGSYNMRNLWSDEYSNSEGTYNSDENSSYEESFYSDSDETSSS